LSKITKETIAGGMTQEYPSRRWHTCLQCSRIDDLFSIARKGARAAALSILAIGGYGVPLSPVAETLPREASPPLAPAELAAASPLRSPPCLSALYLSRNTNRAVCFPLTNEILKKGKKKRLSRKKERSGSEIRTEIQRVKK
jgi:hypothetical protein